MEYIQGETLESKLCSEILNLETALRYAIQIVEALAEAHEKGVVHRDVKPGNIMVDTKGRIKVMDFGLAKLKNDSTITAKNGARLGTVAYMSPEQIKDKEIDQRTDLFSLGVVLYEMLAVTRPFKDHKPAGLLYAIVNNEAPSLSDQNPETPQDICNLINRLLEKKPAERYQNTNELLIDLKKCLQKLIPKNVQKNTSSLPNYGLTNSTFQLPSVHSKKALAILSPALVILIIIGYGLFTLLNSPNVPSDHRLAILPFESASQQAEDILFTDGFHEALINSLAGIGDLTVIARRSALRYAKGERDLRKIGRELDVSSLVDGTVRRIDDRVRVSIQLIDVKTLGTVWSDSFEENMDDIFTIQSRIAQQVAGKLQASLTKEERERLEERPTNNTLAYLLYMQGQEYLSQNIFIKENLQSAEQLLSNAVEKDPSFAQAWAKLTHTYFFFYWFHDRSPLYLQRMKETAERAQMLAPNLPETQLAIGMYLYWSDPHKARTLSHFNKALEQNPNQFYLHTMAALTYRRLGNWEMLIHHLNKAFEVDPLAPGIYTEFSWDYWMMRDYEKAEYYLNQLRDLKLATDLSYHWFARLHASKNGNLEGYEQWWDALRPADPAIAEPYYYGIYNIMKRDWKEAIRSLKNEERVVVEDSEVQYLLRDYLIELCLDFQGNRTEAFVYYERAKNILEDLRDEHPDEPRYRRELARVYAQFRNAEKAIFEAEKAVELMPVSQNADAGTWFEMTLAEIYAWTGHPEQAIDKLEYLLSIPSRVHRNDLRLDPIWDSLRDNPRFQKLIAGEDKPYLEEL